MDKLISFRDIQINDFVRCQKILSQLTNKNEIFSVESFSTLLASLKNDHRIIGCFYNDIEAENEHLVGIGTILIEHKLIHNCSCVGHIEDIAVDEKYRNLNIGKMLINNLVNIAKDKNAYKVILNCNQEKTGFYEKCGFHKSNFEMRINI